MACAYPRIRTYIHIGILHLHYMNFMTDLSIIIIITCIGSVLILSTNAPLTFNVFCTLRNGRNIVIKSQQIH